MTTQAWLAIIIPVLIVAYLLFGRGLFRKASKAVVEKIDPIPDAALKAIADAAVTGDPSAVEAVLRQHAVPERQYERARSTAFMALVQRAVADDVIDDKEAQQLESAKVALRFTEKASTQMIGAVVMPMLEGDVKTAMKDRRITKQELDAIDARAERLKVKLILQGDSTQMFQRFKNYARWELGDLPDVHAPIALQKNERCHYVASARWQERRVRRTRTGYSGFSTSIPIVKGVRYRVGTIRPVYTESEDVVEVDVGTMVYTSKRLIFVGGRGTKTFQWSSVLSITPYSDAVEFARSSGKHPIFALSDGESAAVMATAILSSL